LALPKRDKAAESHKDWQKALHELKSLPKESFGRDLFREAQKANASYN
jgi:hypothetical protein